MRDTNVPREGDADVKEEVGKPSNRSNKTVKSVMSKLALYGSVRAQSPCGRSRRLRSLA
jgi:hypothetical protein